MSLLAAAAQGAATTTTTTTSATTTTTTTITEPNAPGTVIHSTSHRIIDWTQSTTLVNISQLAGYNHLREQDDIVYDPADPDPDKRWKLYFSAAQLASQPSGTSHIWATFSPDKVTWSTPVPCTVGGVTLVGEDPTITQTLSTTPSAYRDSGQLVMFAENGDENINVFSSVDGIAWTLDQQDVLVVGASGEWDDSLVGSPCARHDGTRYLLGYEGIEYNVESSGLAYGTSRTSLTKIAANPILTAYDWGFTGTNASAFMDSFWLTPDGSTIQMTGHSGYDAGSQIRMWRAYTTNLDPLTWTLGDFTLIGMADFVRNDLTVDWWGDRVVTTLDNDSAIISAPLKVP